MTIVVEPEAGTDTCVMPEVAEFLRGSPLKAVIGGRDVAALDGETFVTRDPGTGEPIAEVAAMKAPEVDVAVKAAAKAFTSSGWSTMPVNERAIWIHRLADAIERHKAIIGQIEAMDAGKIPSQAAADVQNCVDTLRYFNQLAQYTQRRNALPVSGHEAWTLRQPWGACGFIFPWNFPLLLIGWGISPALAAGNTVVIKPAEDTPLSTLYFCKLAQEAGIPDGVINVVTGLGDTAGAALARHPGIKRMSFTGSPEVGRKIGEACGRNLVPTKLELGGKGAAVVFEEVPGEGAAEALVEAGTFNSGQAR